VPVVDSPDILRRRCDRLTKRRSSLTQLRYALAPELGHETRDNTAGMWDHRAANWFVVMQRAPLGHDGLSKWNQQWNDLASSCTRLGAIRVTLPFGVSTCGVRRCCAIILQYWTEELVPFLLPTITPGGLARCSGQPAQAWRSGEWGLSELWHDRVRCHRAGLGDPGRVSLVHVAS
jgi:hypothetical protein